MHILLLPSWYPKTPNDVSGVFFRDQALALHNYGHQVGVIAPSLRSVRTVGKAVLQAALPDYENDLGVMTYRKDVFAVFPRVPYGNYWVYRRAAKVMLKRYIAEHGKPDILHAHAAIFGGAAGAELAFEFKIPLVLTEHSTGFAREVYPAWQLELARKAFSAAESRIAVSPSLVELLSMQFSFSVASWKWIPNVVADRFSTSVRSGDSERPTRFLNLALMSEKKGQHDLIEAFAKLASAGVSAELWLAGDGPLRQRLKEVAAKLGVLNKIRFLGLVEPEDVPRLLGEVDVMVVSSHYETFGVVAAEALMAGLPVIATRCGGPECIVGEGDGFLVPPRDSEAMFIAMSKMLGELHRYDNALIAQRASERFSSKAIAKTLSDEYESVVATYSLRALL